MPYRVLVPIDFSASSRVALARAEEVALATHGEVLLLHVGEEVDHRTLAAGGFLPAHPRADQKVGVGPALAALTNQLQSHGVRARAMHVDGSPRAKILDAIAFERVALVVMGTHGRQGIARLLLGSVSARITQSSPVPVIVCRPPAVVDAHAATPGAGEGATRIKRLRNIVVATDFEPGCEAALGSAFELGEKLGAKVFVLHAYSPVVTAVGNGVGAIAHEALHSHALGRMRLLVEPYRASPAMAQCLAVMGEPALTILERIDELHGDLVVLGSHGRSELQRTLLGSVAEAVLRDAPCEVMIAKSALRLSAADD